MAWVFHGLGLVVTAAALIYVGLRILSSASLIGEDFTNPAFLTAIAVGTWLYALLCILIGLAWVTVIDVGHSGTPLGFREGLIIFGRSQILKYLPTNVLHLVGRYAMAHRTGVSDAPLIFATLAETGLLAMAAGAVAIVFALPLFLQYVSPVFSINSPLLAVLIALGALGVASLFWFRKQGLLKPRMGLAMTVAFLLYVAFFVLNGALLWGLIAGSTDVAITRYLFIFGVAAAAWLGGFVVPGAPAGFGVREVILTSGLEMAGLGASALAIALGYRVITLGGDVIVALVAFLISRR